MEYILRGAGINSNMILEHFLITIEQAGYDDEWVESCDIYWESLNTITYNSEFIRFKDKQKAIELKELLEKYSNYKFQINNLEFETKVKTEKVKVITFEEKEVKSSVPVLNYDE